MKDERKESSLPAHPIYTLSPVVERMTVGRGDYDAHFRVWRERGTTDWLLLSAFAGAGRFDTKTERVMIEVHDLVLVRPGTPHDYTAEEGDDLWDQFWIHFHPRPEWLPWMSWPEAAPGVLHLRLDEPIVREKIVGRLLETQRLANGGLRQRVDFAMNALEEALLWCDTQNAKAGRVRLDGRVLAVMDFISQRLDQPVRPEDLARVGGLSASRMAHLFRAQMGIPPARFLDQQRFARAEGKLAHGTHPISVVAAELGMDPPYFSHWFKRHTGVSPREYRGRGEA
jgi:AraC family transcriptional regulator of arabinose operon